MLAHNISLINVQAGVALHLMDEQPEQARTALTAIRQASKDALGELRSVLERAARLGEARAADSGAGLDDLDGAGLAGRSRRARRCESTSRASTAPLPAEVDLAAFRIVQEALTNVARHAGPGEHDGARRATARRDLTVQVDDDGARHDAGRDLGRRQRHRRHAGARRRALGGELDAGPGPAAASASAPGCRWTGVR